MPVTLYWHPQSPPARCTALALDVLNVDHEHKFLDLFSGAHKKPEFLKINPQHNVPCLVDGDFIINESVAIQIYLGEKFSDNKPSLYPKDDLKIKSTINQRLVFNSGVFWDSVMKPFVGVIFRGEKTVDQANKDKIVEVLGWVRDFIKPTGWVAGTADPTLADFAFLSTYTSLEGTGDYFVDLKNFPEIKEWAEKVKQLVPNYEKANGEGATMFKKFFESRKPKD